MDAYIIQMDTYQIKESDLINAESIHTNPSEIDYCRDLDNFGRNRAIREFLRHTLPKGMFTLDDNCNAMTYNGGFKQWRENYIQQLHDTAVKVNANNAYEYSSPLCELKSLITNPLQTDNLIFTMGKLERSEALPLMISFLKEGGKVFFGNVIAYHF